MTFCIVPFNPPLGIEIACKRNLNVFEYVPIALVRVDVLTHVPDFGVVGIGVIQLIC